MANPAILEPPEPAANGRTRRGSWVADEARGLLGVVFVVVLFGWGQIRPGTSVPGDLLASIPPWNVLVSETPSNSLLGDAVLSVYPWRKFTNDQLQRGTPPLWNPYIFTGQPAAADPDMALFYPMTLALGWLPPATAFDVHILIHLFVTALGMYVLMRVWGAGPLGGVMAAAVFCGSSAMTVWRLYGNLMSVAAWLPWLIVCFEMSLRRRPAIWIGAGAVTLGLSFTGNFIQWTLYNLLLLALYAGWLALLDAKRGLRALRPLFHAAAIFLLGLAIGAVQVWPLAELAFLSERTETPSFEVLRHGTLRPARLLTLLAPNFFGSPVSSPGHYWGPKNYAESTVYWGFYPLILSLTAPYWRRERVVWFLWGFLFLTASWTLGLPSLRVLAWLPGFNLFMHERMIYLLCFCGAALSGLVIESIFHGTRRSWSFPIVAGLALTGWVIMILASKWIAPAPTTGWMDPTLGSLQRVTWLLALGLPVLAFGVWRPRVAIARIGFCSLTILELARFSLQYVPRSTEEWRLFPPPHFLSAIPRSIAPPRVAAIDHDDALLMPNTLMPFGLAEVGGYSSLIQLDSRQLLSRINAFKELPSALAIGRVRNPGSPLLDLAGVETLLSSKPLEIGDGRLELVTRSDDVYVYRNHRAAPRAFMVANVKFLNLWEDWLLLGKDDFAYCRFATLITSEVPPPTLPFAGHEGCLGTTEIVQYHTNTVEIRVTTPEDGLLVFTDAYFPGWKAIVDGVEQTIHRVDGVFRGVWLKAGDHDVYFKYRPRSVLWGAVLSAGSVTLAISLIVIGVAVDIRTTRSRTLERHGQRVTS